MPEKYLDKAKYRDNTANDPTKCIIDVVRLNGGYAEGINNIGIPTDRRRQVTDGRCGQKFRAIQGAGDKLPPNKDGGQINHQRRPQNGVAFVLNGLSSQNYTISAPTRPKIA